MSVEYGKWRPIATLPNDPGQHVLAFDASSRCVQVVYRDIVGDTGELYETVTFKKAKGNFTHWMPTPKSPRRREA